ncbi:MAG: Gfo/Idh/MocA family oxidoreductase [Phycisphaerales bacterium]|nr:Gfo/Idh/MocA family oxidoreductase [Phycisphaerales bacterium]
MVHIALVGCGGMAHWHADKLIKLEEARVVALCDTRPRQTAEFKAKYFPDAAEYPSLEALLEKPPAKLDAVILITPHTLHYPQCLLALDRGLHVLVEKPMVTSSEHAYDLWRRVKQTGRTFAIAFQAPYTPEYQAIAHMRDSGLIGTPQIIAGWLAQGWKQLTTGTWRQDPRLSGGGQMYDSGAHVFNGIMWIMNNPVVEVACFLDNAGTPVDINGVAIMKFANGALGSVAIGGNSPGWDVSITLQSDQMTIKTGPHGGFLEATRGGRKYYPFVPQEDHPAAGSPSLNFIRAILGREKLVSPVRFGVLLSVLMDALYESARTGAPVRVKPVPDDLP